MQQKKIKIKKIINIISILILLLVSCKSNKSVINNVNIDYQEYSIEKFDSICIIDNLSQNLNDWYEIYLQDYETNIYHRKLMYIKILNNSYNLIYIIEDNKILKRKIYD